MGFSGLGATAAHATSSFKFTNEFGADRYATAANNNATAFPAGVNTVVLADAIPGHQSDALAASGYAGINGYGILLTDNTNTVPAPTMSALSSLKVKNVIALGGSAAVSSAQISQLTAAGYTVTQPFQGANGYATMQAIDSSITPSSVGTSSGGLKTAILASGDTAHLIDATASSGLAYGMKFPVITTESSSSTLGPEAQAVVTKLGIQKLIPVGGSAAIPTTQYSPAPSGMSVDNSATTGADRSATSVALANDASTNYGFDSPLTNMILATGATFVGSTTTTQNDGADALSSGPLGGVTKSVTILTVSPTDPGQAVNFAKAHSSTLDPGYLDSGQLSTSGVAQQVQTAAQGGTGGSGNTSLPQLVSAAILQTVTPAQATPAGTLPGPAGTYVGYTFSQAVAGDAFTPGAYKVYDASDNEYTAFAASALGSSAPNTVAAYFPWSCASTTSAGAPQATAPCPGAPVGANLTTTSGAATLTLATVAGPDGGGPAVSAPSGKSPAGSASIGTASSTGAAAAGVTTAPNPESWAITNTSGANSTNYPNGTPINITFDKAAFAQVNSAAAPGAGAYPSAPAGQVNSTGFEIVLAKNGGGAAAGKGAVTCVGPNATDTTTASGGTVAGGNGTTTLTIVCPDTPTAGTPITAAQIARVVVLTGAVGTTAPAGAGDVTNPTEAADTAHSASTSPDLTSVAFVPGATATTNDQIVYTFDQAIAAANKLDYGFYLSNGTEQDCGVVNCTGAVVNPSNFDQVVVTVQPAAGAGPNATLGATGGIAYANAATAANGAPALLNADDEVGGANPNNPASTIMPGTVNGPQLQSVHVASTSTALGTTTTATYTFSEAVKNPIAAVGGLHLYDPDGTELTCNALAVPSAATVPAAPNNNQVICTSFVQNAAGGAATTTQLTAAALGTVDYNTVVGNATGTTGASNPGQNNVNPEGGVATS